ncbi:MAG TPA: hypothetical protein DEB39_12770 [Planctomycetaceae bacterium]|nr:hypothetical protein [Planctomycetaceae bacterium]
MMQERPRKIWVTGHSLGGALATLATRRLTMEADYLNEVDPIATFTFGQPRVGDTQMCRQIGSPFYRFAYVADPVTWVPFSVPAFVEYAHAGDLRMIDKSSTIRKSATDWFLSYGKSLIAVAAQMTTTKLVGRVSQHIRSHYMDNYIQRITTAIKKEKSS